MNYQNKDYRKTRKQIYQRPTCETIRLNLSGRITETHVSAVNLNGFDKGEVPGITIDDDDEEEPNAKSFGTVKVNPWSEENEDLPDKWL